MTDNYPDYDVTHPLIGGFDPGKKGALVTIRAISGKLETVSRIPLIKTKQKHRDRATTVKAEIDWPLLAEEWREPLRRCRRVFIEHIWGAAPRSQGRRDGGPSQFKLGYAAGVPFGLMLSLGVPYQFITPQVWHKALAYPKNEENSKAPSFELARKFFPESVEEFKRVTVDEGVAEASLIAYVGRQILEQGDDDHS